MSRLPVWLRPAPQTEAHRAVGLWLLACAGLVLAMIVVGGLTRLTNSGLSMVEWKPLTGLLPPLSEAAWQDLFAKYQQYPEFQRINTHMTLADFQGIFWLEFIHRVLGRVVGLAFALPLVAFLVLRVIPWRAAPRYLLLFALGGLQGLLGWWMVRSGLVGRPDVSHFRLAAHLGLAFLIMGVLVTHALAHLDPRAPQTDRTVTGIRRRLLLALSLVSITVIFGAFVAGTDAGLMYNTFPAMNGQMIPDGVLEIDPWWLNPLENIITIQFLHRWLAIATLITVLVAVAAVHRAADALPHAIVPARLMAGVVVAQVCLGIATLLLHVPVALASLHQTGAALLFGATIWTLRNALAAPTARRRAPAGLDRAPMQPAE